MVLQKARVTPVYRIACPFIIHSSSINPVLQPGQLNFLCTILNKWHQKRYITKRCRLMKPNRTTDVTERKRKLAGVIWCSSISMWHERAAFGYSGNSGSLESDAPSAGRPRAVRITTTRCQCCQYLLICLTQTLKNIPTERESNII